MIPTRGPIGRPPSALGGMGSWGGGSGAHPTRRQRRRRRFRALVGSAVIAGGGILIGMSLNHGGAKPAQSAAKNKKSTQGSWTTNTLKKPAITPATAESKKGFALDPTLFASGACLAYSPTSKKANHHTVFIDAGHGGLDPGAKGTTNTGNSIYEATLTLPVAKSLTSMLRAKGYRVVLSRTRNSQVIRLSSSDVTGKLLTATGVHADIAGRAQCANIAKATLLVGIYFDAGATPQNAGCISAYDAARTFSNTNYKFATLLQTDVLKQLNGHNWQIPDDGVVSDSTLGGPPLTSTASQYRHLLLLGPALAGWFTTPSNMPGSIIEPLFITDPMEGSVADSAVGQEAIATGMSQAVISYFAPSATTQTALQSTLATATTGSSSTTTTTKAKTSKSHSGKKK